MGISHAQLISTFIRYFDVAGLISWDIVFSNISPANQISPIIL
jgi:hypothetical protein